MEHDSTVKVSIVSETLDNYASGKIDGLQKLQRLGADVPPYITIGAELSEPEISALFERLDSNKNNLWAVRSSANVEDGFVSSFAGIFESVIGITGDEIRDAIQVVRQSAKSEIALAYCREKGIDPDQISMNVIIQEFKEPLLSGVWMGRDDGGGRLEWLSGRGDQLVGGLETPHWLEYDSNYVSMPVGDNDQDEMIDQHGIRVVEYCRKFTEALCYPLDLEFCITKEGLKWLQLRPITKSIDIASGSLSEISIDTNNLFGQSVSSVNAEGIAHRFDQQEGDGWTRGLILLAKQTTPSMMRYVMTSNGVLAEVGGALSHAAVVCRELGKACIVGVDISLIPHNAEVKISGSDGKVTIT
jgi:phosphoenolpyruvate synthase/pyruvate phosphate dikinase